MVMYKATAQGPKKIPRLLELMYKIKYKMRLRIYALTHWYVQLPHRHYVVTNYGRYPDTLITRVVFWHYSKIFDSDNDLYLAMLDVFGVEEKPSDDPNDYFW